MICSVCGKPQPCVHSLASSRVVLEHAAGKAEMARVEDQISTREPAAPSFSLQDLAAQVRAQSDERTWREEVVLRVNRHRAKRGRGDDESLRLEFPAEQALTLTAAPVLQRRYISHAATSSGALISTGGALQPESPRTGQIDGTVMRTGPEIALRARQPKIISFPKYSPSEIELPQAPLITEIELAEPAPTAPRIMESRPAEQLELLPSFADIRLDATPREELFGDRDIPLRTASLSRRVIAGLLDVAIVGLALVIFSGSFTKMVPTPVPVRVEVLSLVLVGVVLWLVFQYLFLTYSTSTPGMRAARLQLFTFSGRHASFTARRSRVLASGLSALSVGLGYAWALVDEDGLGWHDRISQTYLKIG